MRKLSKMLALGLALVLTLGMTVSAKESVATGTTNAETEALGEKVTGGAVVGVAGSKIEFGDIYAEDKAVADEIVKEMLSDEDIKDAEIIAGTDVKPVDADGNVLTGTQTVQINIPEIKLGKEYVALHLGTNGWEALEVVVIIDGRIEVTSDNWSPIFIVEVEEKDDAEDAADDNKTEETKTTATGAVASPKTGEVMPIASVIAVICLAGVAVCAKKAHN